MTALIRIEIPGRWETEPGPEEFPGRALQSWFYGQLAERDQRLAEELHDSQREKPFHVAMVRREEADVLVLAAYGPLVGQALSIAGHVTGRLAFNARWWRPVGQPSIEQADWDELAAPLLAVPAARLVRMRFLTPTTFRSNGNYLPLPAPSALFSSLLERWREWAPISLGEHALEAVPRIAIRRHRLQSVPVQLKGMIPTFVGVAEFEMRERLHPYAGLAAVLGQFARFSGVGAKVTTGLGCVEAELVAPVPRT